MRTRLRPLLLLGLFAILLPVPPASAQYDDERGSEDDGIRQSVARVSWLDGEVSFNRGDDPDDWQPAAVNYPMTLGDRIWASRDARVELQLRGGTIYLASETELAALDLARDVRQLSLNLGTTSFRIRRMEPEEVFEVATPNVSVTFETAGIFRIDVDEDGNSRVSVSQGRAWVAAAGGQVVLEGGEQIRVRGIDRPEYDVVRLARPDSWDRWVENRARRYRSVRSASYVHPDIYGVDDLDAYGTWESNEEYGTVWYPREVAAGWEPYRAGRWIWRDPWGWTWLSSEPWGWAPYHYGRWALSRGRWCWIPVGPQSRYPGYSPAVVGFVGGGAGWSVSVSAGGFVGWFPIGPREPFEPWWHRSRPRDHEPAWNYAYRNRVTVVSRDVFVRGGRVDRDVVRDTRIVGEVSRAPVLRGPIPVLPTRDSIRVPRADGRRDVMRPPAEVGRREVVTRSVPPPAPPSFDRTLDVIRDRGGEPVSADVARRISAEERRGETRIQPVRPAGGDGIQLSPRADVATTRRPEPLPPSTRRASPEVSDRPVRADETSTPRVTEPRREAVPTRPAYEQRYDTVPTRPAYEPRREAVPTRAANEPRHVEEPAPTPARGWALVPRSEPRREAVPTAPAPETRSDNRDVARPPERGFDRPTPAPTERVPSWIAPEPRKQRSEATPVPARPFETESRPAETRRAVPDRVEPRRVEPEKVEVKATPTPKPKVDAPPPRKRSEPDPSKD